MKITSLELINFKRFSKLRIENIPTDTQLVLLIGSNGSGKSCVFDAFDWLQKGLSKGMPYQQDESLQYYRKQQHYSIENLMYHPDNMEEYYAKQGRNFDKENYINALTKEKQNKQLYIAGGITKARDGYPFFKDAALEKQRKKFISNYTSVIDMLASDDFETFYKVFPAKDYGTQLPERQNIPKDHLAKTQWFRRQVEQAIGK